MMQRIFYLILSVSFLMALSCSNPPKSAVPKIAEVASSDKLWTGLAISEEGRLFVNYPKWSEEAGVSVAEIIKGEAEPYPNESMNRRISDSSTISRFSCVQSLYADHRGHLWILDPANPYFQGVEPTGPRLYRVDLQTDSVSRVYTFEKGTYRDNSYFNDVRIDSAGKHAYITDSGDGAIIVLNLQSGGARRLLDTHPSTAAETDYLVINHDSLSIEVDSDGIALSSDGKHLYYTALSGHSLYSIPTAALLDTNLTETETGARVKKVQEILATDGILFNEYGTLFLGGLENNAVYTHHPASGYSMLLSHPEVKWADSFARDANGSIYFTTSQLHIPEAERGKFKIYKIVYH
ncbi:MAG: L-dopachrome tautomerase-related protein [Bacteroidota bacterium]|nr:L-dopachrome tautomerase-related protein [Bacteroidota bacterium]